MNARCYPVVLLCLLVMAPTVGAQSISYLSVASAFITQSTTPTATPTVAPPLITREYVIDPQGNGDFATIPAFITGTAGLAGSGYKVVGHLVPGVHMTPVTSDVRLRRNQYLRGASRDASVVICYAAPTTYRFILTSGSGLENLTWVRAPCVYLCLQEDSGDSDYVQLATVHRVSFKTLRSFYGEESGTYPTWGEMPYVFCFGKDSDPDCDGMTLYIRDSSFEGNSILLSSGTNAQNSANGTTDVILENCDVRMELLDDDETSPPTLPAAPVQAWRGGNIRIEHSTIATDREDFGSTSPGAMCLFAHLGSTYSATVEVSMQVDQSALVQKPYPSTSCSSYFVYISQGRTSGNTSMVSVELDGVQLVTDGDYDYITRDLLLYDSSSAYDADLGIIVTCHDTDTAKVSCSGNNAVVEQARVIEVDVKGSKDFTSIQDAIDAISDNANDNPYLILVYPGVYALGPDDLIELKSFVTIRGQERERVVIQPDIEANWTGVSFPVALVDITGSEGNPVDGAALERVKILLDPETSDAWKFDGEAIRMEHAHNIVIQDCYIQSNWDWSWITPACVTLDRGDTEEYRRSVIMVKQNVIDARFQDIEVQAKNDSTMLAVVGDAVMWIFRCVFAGYDTPDWSFANEQYDECHRKGYRGSAVVIDSGTSDVNIIMFHNCAINAHRNGRGVYLKSTSPYSWIGLNDTCARWFCIDIDNYEADILNFLDYGAMWTTRYGRVCSEDLKSNKHMPTPLCEDEYMTPILPTPPPPVGGGNCTPPPPTETPTP